VLDVLFDVGLQGRLSPRKVEKGKFDPETQTE
jgi:hypothetical protein